MVALVSALVVPSLVTVPSAGATTPSSAKPAGARSGALTPPPVSDPRLATALENVPVSSPYYYEAAKRYGADWRTLTATRALERSLQARLVILGTAEARLVAEIYVAARREQKSQDRLRELSRELSSLAVSEYVAEGSNADDLSALDPARASATQASHVLVDIVSQTRLTDVAVNEAIVHSTGAARRTDQASLTDVRRRQAAATADLATAQRDEASEVAEVDRDRSEVADTRLTAQVTGTDLLLIALNAAWKAAATMGTEDPGCHLPWAAITGIGRVESENGLYGDDSLSAAGEEAHPIIGIALDGTNNTQLVPDTDGGALDHDPTYDRAVGPMQVLPSAWRRYGRDGDDDGTKDPQNIYDAMLTAGVMLCRYGSLATDAGLRTAFYHYNPSQAYVDEVLTNTHEYRDLGDPPGRVTTSARLCTTCGQGCRQPGGSWGRSGKVWGQPWGSRERA